jgi:cytochrome b561
MEKRNYSTIYRIMHWSIAICLLLILLTIFLRSTWLSRDHIAAIIKGYLATTDQSLSEEHIMAIARKIRKPMWDWHIYLGYTMVGLYSIRMLLPLIGEMKFSNPFTKGLSLKIKIQYWSYWIFYFCVAISLSTGLLMEFGPKSINELMEEIHVLSIYYLLAYIVLHLGGVFWAEFTDQKGIVSDIVSGNKNAKGGKV